VALKVSENGQNCFYYEFFSQLERRRTLAEEKRLLYVAMTRARSYLVCSGSPALKESGAADKSLWDLSADIFNGAGAQNLCAVRRCTKTEIINLPLPEPESVKPAKELSADEIQQIRTLIQPVSLAPTLEKLTATAFAEKIVAAESDYQRAAGSGQRSRLRKRHVIQKAFSGGIFSRWILFKKMLCDLYARTI
jgi:ATP-dependent exoDNAse (exonuclease V) beta subunit